MSDKVSTKQVQDWWDKNPFTLGVATGDFKNKDLVGRIDAEKMNLEYFQEIERRFRKHSGTGGQEKDKPLLSKFIDSEKIRNKDVLDIAVGTGLHTVMFAAEGARVTGIDITPFAVTQTKKNLEVRGLHGTVLQMDAQKMSFPDSSFDLVNAWGCLMHMPDTKKAISEIHRVLRPGGSALAYMYNKNSWPFWFNTFFLRGILLGGLIKYKGNITKLTSRYSDGASQGGNFLTKFYTPEEVSEMFIKAGFKNVKSYSWDIGYEPDGWPMRVFPVFQFLPARVKSYMSKHWGYGLIVEANK